MVIAAVYVSEKQDTIPIYSAETKTTHAHVCVYAHTQNTQMHVEIALVK